MLEKKYKLLLKLLNDIEVKGANNLNNLLASIQIVQGLLEPKEGESDAK